MRSIRILSSRLTFTVFIFTILLGASAFCQKGSSTKIHGDLVAPPPVTASLHNIFPNATFQDVDTMTINSVNCYKIEVIDGSERRSAVFSSAGLIIEVVDQITVAALPGRIQNAVSRNFPLATIVEAYKKTASDGYEYTVKVAAKKDTTQLIFTSTAMTISSKGGSEKSRADRNTGLAGY